MAQGPTTPIRVFLAEDHPVYRGGLRDAMQSDSRLVLAGEADDGQEALERIRETKPDIALLDFKLPVLDGLEIVVRLAKETLDTRFILLSGYSEIALVYEALDAGASGYLSKESSAAEICAAVVSVAAGERAISPGIEKELVARIGRSERGQGLSAREKEVLALIGEGLASSAIGERLNLSEGTVKTYIARAYEKLGVTNRGAAIAEAMRRGILR